MRIPWFLLPTTARLGVGGIFDSCGPLRDKEIHAVRGRYTVYDCYWRKVPAGRVVIRSGILRISCRGGACERRFADRRGQRGRAIRAPRQRGFTARPVPLLGKAARIRAAGAGGALGRWKAFRAEIGVRLSCMTGADIGKNNVSARHPMWSPASSRIGRRPDTVAWPLDGE